jgi:hypothetical protein
MDKRVTEKLEEGFCKVLHEISEHDMRSPEEVETAKAALSGLVKMKMLEEMENFRNGYSGRMYRDDGASYRDYGGGMYRDDGASYRGYYRDGNVAEKVMSKLREMSQNADPQEKRELEMMMSKLR